MKSLQALGLVMLIVGGLLIMGVVPLRPVGGALAICGAGLVILGWINPRRKKRKPRERYSWEEDGTREPTPIYQPQPSEVRLRERPSDVEVAFTSPNPGSIPAPRQNNPLPGTAEYTAGRGEIPAPRERERGIAEYTVPVPEGASADFQPPPLTAGGLSEEIPAEEDPYLPPMAPPPPG